MESSPENSITQDFNPFVSTAAPQGMGATGLIYEPLYQFDLANPTVQYPWLATHYAWGPGGKSITFTIRQGVKWSNGTALTPADVAFTYNYIKKNASINCRPGHLPVTTSGDNVTVSFATSQYTNLENIAGVAILPIGLGIGHHPRHLHRREPGRHRPVHAGLVHAGRVHAGQEPELLAGEQGRGPQGLLPGLHLEHRRAERPVLRADRLDR